MPENMHLGSWTMVHFSFILGPFWPVCRPLSLAKVENKEMTVFEKLKSSFWTAAASAANDVLIRPKISLILKFRWWFFLLKIRANDNNFLLAESKEIYCTVSPLRAGYNSGFCWPLLGANGFEVPTFFQGPSMNKSLQKIRSSRAKSEMHAKKSINKSLFTLQSILFLIITSFFYLHSGKNTWFLL